MLSKHIPPKAIEALERAITRVVQQRIDDDPDVADAFLRIGIHAKSFTVLTLYLEESNVSQRNRDVPLLNLMRDRFNRDSCEDWVPDTAAIRKLAESYSELIELDSCLNQFLANLCPNKFRNTKKAPTAQCKCLIFKGWSHLDHYLMFYFGGDIK